MRAEKKRFILSVIFLVAGIVYMVFPMDIIPDVLGPIGWIDDVGLLLASFLYAAYSYGKSKKHEVEEKNS